MTFPSYTRCLNCNQRRWKDKNRQLYHFRLTNDLWKISAASSICLFFPWRQLQHTMESFFWTTVFSVPNVCFDWYFHHVFIFWSAQTIWLNIRDNCRDLLRDIRQHWLSLLKMSTVHGGQGLGRISDLALHVIWGRHSLEIICHAG